MLSWSRTKKLIKLCHLRSLSVKSEYCLDRGVFCQNLFIANGLLTNPVSMAYNAEDFRDEVEARL